MAHPISSALGVAPSDFSQEASMRDYIALMKPGVLLLVVFSAFTGMMLAPGQLHPVLALIALLSIALGSGAGAMFNMWYDRDIDAVMSRTQKRPIAAGRIAADDALVLCVLLSIASVSLLSLATNWLAGAMLAFAIFFYAIIYTHYLKRHTDQNIVIGGAAGAFPPVIGWLAVTGADLQFLLAPLPWALFLIVFLWTPPHFWALALYRHDDYRKVNVPMLPVVKGEKATKRAISLYSIALVASTFLPMLYLETQLYAVAATLLGAMFLYHAARVHRSDDPKIAIRMFIFSISYLFLLFSSLLLDRLFFG